MPLYLPGGPPSGSVFQWLTTTAPTGYLLCYGQAVSRTTYALIYAVIGTTFGVGDGSTTFNLPDFRGRIPLGKDNMGGSSANVVTASAADTIGGTGGEENHTLDVSEMPAHTHTTTCLTAQSSRTQTAGGSPPNVPVETSPTSSSTGGGSAHNNMQPYITVNYIIKI